MQRQIYYHDTDAGGVVYYANYLKYLEEARTEYFEERGLTAASLASNGGFYAVRSCNIVYKAPARYGDIISADAKVSKTSGFQMFFRQSVRNHQTGRVLVEAEVALVFLDKDFQLQPIPLAYKEKCHENIE